MGWKEIHRWLGLTACTAAAMLLPRLVSSPAPAIVHFQGDIMRPVAESFFNMRHVFLSFS